MNIKFGPGGTDGLGYEKGIEYISGIGLNALEVEFTYGVRMKNDEAKKIGELAKSKNIDLSIHAPYYINLTSLEKPKIHASITRILQSCERGHHMGAKYVVFHAGFYQGREKDVVYDIMIEKIKEIMIKLKEKKLNIKIAPEITGKPSAFGDLDELLKIKKETGCHLTIDFAHIKARQHGKIDYDSIFSKVKSLDHIHAHFSGIEWTEKGEKKHIPTDIEEMRRLLNSIIKYNADITIINESPNPIQDSVKMKEIFKNLIKS